QAGPNERVVVRIAVDGTPTGPLGYITPALPQLTVKPYHASSRYRIWRSTALMVIVGLLCALLIGFAISSVLRRPASSLQRRVAEFVTLYSPTRGIATAPTGAPPRSSDPDAKPSLQARLAEALAIADITMSVTQLVLGTAALTVVMVFGLATAFGTPVFGLAGL